MDIESIADALDGLVSLIENDELDVNESQLTYLQGAAESLRYIAELPGAEDIDV